MYLPFLKRLKCFDDIYVLFDEFRGLRDDISAITKRNAQYIEDTIGFDTELYLIGHSMGGLECLEIAARYGSIREHVKSITTLCTPIYGCSKLTEPFSKKYKAVVDMQPQSAYLNRLHYDYGVNEKTPPVLNVQAGLDHLVPAKNSFLYGNEFTSRVKSAMHTNILLYPRTAQEIYGFNTYKIMESNGLDIDPVIHFEHVIVQTKI